MSLVLHSDSFDEEKDLRKRALMMAYDDLSKLEPGSEEYQRQIDAIVKMERQYNEEQTNDKTAELKEKELKQSKWKSILDIVIKFLLGIGAILLAFWQHSDSEKNLNARLYSAQEYEKDGVIRSASSKSVQNEAMRKTKEYRSIV